MRSVTIVFIIVVLAALVILTLKQIELDQKNPSKSTVPSAAEKMEKAQGR